MNSSRGRGQSTSNSTRGRGRGNNSGAGRGAYAGGNSGTPSTAAHVPRVWNNLSTTERDEIISKTLSFYLRHGSNIGLLFYRDGFVDEEQLFQMRTLNRFSKAEVRAVINNSTSTRFNSTRFEERFINGHALVRATYGHSIDLAQLQSVEFPLAGESSPWSKDANSLSNTFQNQYDHLDVMHDPMSLTRQCLKSIARNITLYENFDALQDTFILENIIDELRRSKQLTNKALRIVLSSGLDTLQAGEEVLLTDTTLRLVTERCVNLSVLRLADCLALTEHQIKMFCKRLTRINCLELVRCTYVNDNALQTIGKTWASSSLRTAVFIQLPSITAAGLEELVLAPKTLSLQSLSVIQCEKLQLTQEQFDKIKTRLNGQFVYSRYSPPSSAAASNSKAPNTTTTTTTATTPGAQS